MVSGCYAGFMRISELAVKCNDIKFYGPHMSLSMSKQEKRSVWAGSHARINRTGKPVCPVATTTKASLMSTVRVKSKSGLEAVCSGISYTKDFIEANFNFDSLIRSQVL